MKRSKRVIWGALALSVAGILPVVAQNNPGNSPLRSNQVIESVVWEDKTVIRKSAFNDVKETDAIAKKDETAAPSAPATAVHDWSGGYFGAYAGAGWGKGDTFFNPLPSAAAFINLRPTNVQVKPRGAVVGVQGGYNWQAGNFVIGGEADIAWSDMKRNSLISPITQNNGTPFPGNGSLSAGQKTKWIGTLRPRVGAAFGKVLVYGTAGLAFGSVRYTANTDFRPAGTTQYIASLNKTRRGWTAGGGVEIALTSKWSIKGEYRYYDLGNQSATVNATPSLPPFQVAYTFQTKAHNFIGGVNFHF